uniref:Candidate secreted effector n=1 Tax=Meloidogyne incognita TaxID=6306 RepID=A0A914N461_MELIC
MFFFPTHIWMPHPVHAKLNQQLLQQHQDASRVRTTLANIQFLLSTRNSFGVAVNNKCCKSLSCWRLKDKKLEETKKNRKNLWIRITSCQNKKPFCIPSTSNPCL